MAEDTAGKYQAPEKDTLYEDAYAAYDKQSREAKAAYENMAREARVNKALIERAARQSDSAAGITYKAAARTVGQRSENSLRNTLGKAQRQYENYNKNVEHALENLSIQEAADEKSFAARRESEANANKLSQRVYDAEYGLQKKQIDLFKEESDFDKAFQLFLMRKINKNKFKDITGIKVKSLPSPRRPKNIFSDPNLKNAGSVPMPGANAANTPTDKDRKSYLETNKAELIKKYGKAQYDLAVEYFNMKAADNMLGGVSKSMTELNMLVNSAGTDKALSFDEFYKKFEGLYAAAGKEVYGTPAYIKPGANPDSFDKSKYIVKPYSLDNPGMGNYYISSDLSDALGAKKIDIYDKYTHELKSEGRLMLEYLGISVGTDVDYNTALDKVKGNNEDIISLFGIDNYRDVINLAGMKSRCAYYKAADVCPTVNKLENLMIYSIGDKDDLPGMLETAEAEIAKIDNIFISENAYSYDALTEYYPELKDRLVYNTYGEDPLRKQLGVTPQNFDVNAFVSGLDMPDWYEMPKELTKAAVTDAINTNRMHEYWKDTLGQNYSDQWTEQFPEAEEITEKGRESAKAKAKADGKGEKFDISDEFAYYYGILTIKDELLEKSGPKPAVQDKEVRNDNIYYAWNPNEWLTNVAVFDPANDMPSIIIEKVNTEIGNLLWKKYNGEKTTEEDYKLLNKYGMTDVIEQIDNMPGVEYGDLPESIRKQMKQDVLDEGRYAFFDFTPEELEILKTAEINEIDQRIAAENANQQPDKQWLSALKLYRYYKNDLDIEVTGDYEADRSKAKEVLVERLYELTGIRDFKEILKEKGQLEFSLNFGGYKEGVEIPEEWQKVDGILRETPAELFMNTEAENEAFYKSADSAFASGLGNGFTLGIISLIGESETDPEDIKEAALLGTPVADAMYYKYGKFYNPAVSETNAKLMQNNPWAYWIGNVVGGIPATMTVGGLAGGIAEAFGAGTKLASFIEGFTPSAIQGGVNAAARGGDIGEIITGAFVEGTFGGVSLGWLSNAAKNGVGRLLANAPGIIQKTVPWLAGKAVDAISNAGLNLLSDAVMGRDIDWEQTLAGLPVDFVFSLVSNGWSGDSGLPDVNKKVIEPETYIHPETGETVTVKRGQSLADVDAEAAKFYYDAANVIERESVRNIEDQFLRYTEALGVDDMPSFGDFKHTMNEGGTAWNDLTLKKGWKEALKSGEIQPFTRFEEYKSASDYIGINAPDLAAKYGDSVDALVIKALNDASENSISIEDAVERIRTEAPDIDSIQGMGDNEKVTNTFKSKQELLRKSTCTKDDFYRYLKRIDKSAADEYFKNGNWPDKVQIPKSPDVLNPDGSINWRKATKGGYVLDKQGNAIKKQYKPFVGEVIDRFGPGDGRYTSPVVDGKPFDYEQRSLPFVEDAEQYHQYKIIGDFSKLEQYVKSCSNEVLKNDINEYVNAYYEGDFSKISIYKGEIASIDGWGRGGGTQYELPFKVQWLEELGLLQEIISY